MVARESPFVLCKIRQPISLLPCHIGETRVGIDQEMTALLMRYSEKLRGVILSFSNVQLERPAGFIMNEQPYIHCKVIADALVFQPREGMVLEGVVNKIGSNHIGMLFAGVFNGSVPASELPKGYVHNYAEDSWKGPNGASIAVDDTVHVQVVRVHVAGGMISIDATMRTATAPKTSKPAKRKSLDLSGTKPAVVSNETSSEKEKKDKKEKKTSKEVAADPATKKRKKERSESVAEEPVEHVVKKKKLKKHNKE